MTARVAFGVFDDAFDEFLRMFYACEYEQYPEVYVAYEEGFDVFLNAYLIPQLEKWPDGAKSMLAETLGASLVAFPEELEHRLLDIWEDPDTIFGHVWRELFEGRGWKLSEFATDPTVYEVVDTSVSDLRASGVDVPAMQWPWKADEGFIVHLDSQHLFVPRLGNGAELLDFEALSVEATDREFGRAIRSRFAWARPEPGRSPRPARETVAASWAPFQELFGFDPWGRDADERFRRLTVERTPTWVRVRPWPGRYRFDLHITLAADVSDEELGAAIRTAMLNHPDTESAG